MEEYWVLIEKNNGGTFTKSLGLTSVYGTSVQIMPTSVPNTVHRSRISAISMPDHICRIRPASGEELLRWDPPSAHMQDDKKPITGQTSTTLHFL